MKVEPESAKEFTLNVRIPGWARNEAFPSSLYRYNDGLKPQATVAVNGRSLNYTPVKGYARISRKWQAGDVVTLNLEMPVRRVVAHPNVKAVAGCIALERGPLVYCAEGADNGGKVLTRALSGKESFVTETRPELLGAIVTVKATGAVGSGTPMTFIPYYAWCHRGTNEMRVWIPTE